MLFLSVAAGCRSGTESAPEALVWTHVTVIDGTGAAPQKDATLVISNRRIAAIGPKQSTPVPPNATVIDGRGKFVIPGLWDMHVHLTNLTELACPVLVANGVTGVRDLGGSLELVDWMRARIEAGALVGPHIFRAGPFVDGIKPGVPDRLVIQSPKEGRRAVDFLKRRGVDFIKVHNGAPAQPYFALLEQARKSRIQVVGHLPFEVDPLEAIERGHGCVEHIVSLFEGPFKRAVQTGLSQRQAMEQFPDAYHQRLAQRMVARGTWFDPTLIAYRYRSYQWDERDRPDPRVRLVAASAAAYWQTFSDLPDRPEVRELLAQAFDRFMQVAAILRQAGVRFLVGTDLAAKYVLPGFSVHDELGLLVQAGFSPMEAIVAATRNSAESLGKLDHLGTLKPGKTADLVVLDADPLDDIGNTKKIFAVVANGRLLRRAALDALLDRVAAQAPDR